MSITRTLYRGTVEYLTGSITADVSLTDADSIDVSFDRTTWYAAEWVGNAGLTRGWQLLVGTTVPLPAGSSHTVYVRVTDNPEAPILKAGILQILGCADDVTGLTGFPIALGSYSMYRGDGQGRNRVVISMAAVGGSPVDLTTFGSAWQSQAVPVGGGTAINLIVDATQAAAGILTISVADADSAGLATRMLFDVQATGGAISPLTVFAGGFTTTGQVTT